MPAPWVIQLIVAIVLYAVAYFLTPRPKAQTSGEQPGETKGTTVEEGVEIPVFFGTVWTEKATIVWWGDTMIEKREYTVGSGSGKK